MPSWKDYKKAAKERGSLAMEFYIVESILKVAPEEMLKHLPGHLDYQKKMEANGSLFLAGPLSDPTGEEMTGNGMIIYRASSMEEAEEIAQNDPMHISGARDYSLRRWLVNEGSLSFMLNLSEQRVAIL